LPASAYRWEIGLESRIYDDHPNQQPLCLLKPLPGALSSPELFQLSPKMGFLVLRYRHRAVGSSFEVPLIPVKFEHRNANQFFVSLEPSSSLVADLSDGVVGKGRIGGVL
jgi:hypothetical protein